MRIAIDQLGGWGCRRQALSTLFVLIWIASSDGTVSPEESERISDFATATGCESDLPELHEMATDPSDRNIIRVVRVLKELPFESRYRLVEFAFVLSLADSKITSGETQILRFLTDALSLSSEIINDLFQSSTGSPTPPASDLSSKDWWVRRMKARDHQGSKRSHARGGEAEHKSERHRHLAVLGLPEDCTQEDVRDAYRRLAAVHHPDKFVCLGPEAVAAAESTFRRIQQAYDWLKSS